MSERKRKWEEWKRKEIADCPPRDRKRWRKFLDSIPMPTLEEERKNKRNIQEAREAVEKVFGKDCKRRSR